MLVAKKLRRDHGFAGYIHLKTIPEASPWLIEQAGLWADRLSINLELPTSSKASSGSRRKRTSDDHRRHGPNARAHRGGTRGEAAGSRPRARARRSSSALMPPRMRRCWRQAPTSISVTSCRASTTPPSAPSITQVRCCPPSARRSPASTGSTRQTGCFGTTASRWTKSLPAAKPACSIWTSIRSSPGRSKIAPASRCASTPVPREMLLRVPGLGKRAVDKIVTARRHTKLRARRRAAPDPGLQSRRAVPHR